MKGLRIFLAAAAVAVPVGWQAEAADTIKIGLAATLTGDWAPYSEVGGVRCMADKINAAGGVDGRMFEVMVEDSRSDPQLVLSIGQRFLDDGAIVVAGTPASDGVIPLAQLAQPYGATVFCPQCTQVELHENAPDNIIAAAVPDPFNAAATAAVAYEMGGRNAVLLESDDAGTWTRNLPEWWGEVFEKKGGKIVGRLNHNFGTTDWSPQITEMLAMSPRPDVVMISSILPDVGILIRQLRAAGSEAIVVGSDGFDDPTLVDVAGGAKNVERVIYATHGFPAEGSALKAFADECRAKGYDINGAFFGLGGDVVVLIQQAVIASNSVDPVKVREAMRKAEGLKGITSDTFDFRHTLSYPMKLVPVIGFKDGQPYVITDKIPEQVPYLKPKS